MKIQPGQMIAGQSALRLRDVLRPIRDSMWGLDELAGPLKVSEEEAERLVAELLRLGYIEKVDGKNLQERYRLTLQGNAFANAKGGPAIPRTTANREIEKFLARVESANSNPHYLFRVERVVLFGSYLSDKEKLGDVDLAITLEPKEGDLDRHLELMKERSQEALSQGRRFSNFVEEIAWGETEVIRYLKGRSRWLSLHQGSDGVLKTTAQRVIYPAPSV